LEQEIAGLGALCATTLMKKDLILPVTGENDWQFVLPTTGENDWQFVLPTTGENDWQFVLPATGENDCCRSL